MISAFAQAALREQLQQIAGEHKRKRHKQERNQQR